MSGAEPPDGSHISENDLVPIICWIDNRKGMASDPGPGLGLIERSRITGDVPDAFSEGELTIYNGLPGELHTKFSQHTLDFSGGNFAFELDKD
jgi:hypothetical protein